MYTKKFRADWRKALAGVFGLIGWGVIAFYLAMPGIPVEIAVGIGFLASDGVASIAFFILRIIFFEEDFR